MNRRRNDSGSLSELALLGLPASVTRAQSVVFVPMKYSTVNGENMFLQPIGIKLMALLEHIEVETRRDANVIYCCIIHQPEDHVIWVVEVILHI